MDNSQKRWSTVLGAILITTFLLQGIFLQEKKLATPGLSGSNKTMVKVQEITLVQEEETTYPSERRFNPQLSRGQVKVLQEGENGLVRKTYLLRQENGVEMDRRLLATTVLREATPEISELGTRDAIMLASRDMRQPRQVITVQATAYTHTGNNTYTGVYPHVGTVAVDPAVIPLGSRLWIEGYGYGIAQDTGGLIQGKRVDLFMDTVAQCRSWGRRTVKVYVLD